MKKLLSTLLLVFTMLLSACGEVKYEYKDGLMYGNEKEATGTFEFKVGEYKAKGNFLNGLPNGIFEEYYPDGNIMIRVTYENGERIKEESYYKNGKLIGIFENNGDSKVYYDNGDLVMSYNNKTKENILYHENGNPLLIKKENSSSIYDENNEVLFEVENGSLVEVGGTLRKIDDGSFQYVKDDRVIATIDYNGEVINYFYSTGQIMISSNEAIGTNEIFFRDGNTFMKEEGGLRVLNYRDGNPLYETEGNYWVVYDEKGNKIVSNFDELKDIKKID